MLVAAAACGSAGTVEPLPTAAPEEGVRIAGVVNGSTFDVLFQDGTTDRVRLLGVDIPDMSQGSTPHEYGDIADVDCLGDWGDRATEFAMASLSGRDVTLIKDPIAGERGEFGWLLAYVEIDGRDFSAMLVERGLARAYVEGDSSRKSDYLASEAMVRTSGAGLWSC